MKQTIIAIIKPIQEVAPYKISDAQFLLQAKLNDTMYSLKEFETLWNSDEVKVKDYYIRFIEAELEVKGCN